MQNLIKYFNLLFIALSLGLILADCNFIDIDFSQVHLSIDRECSELSNHFDSHSVCFEDDVFMNESKVNSNKSLGNFNLVPLLDLNFKNSYFTSIWQPPKFS